MRENEVLLWDKDKSEETLIFRKLMYGNVKDVLRNYKKEILKKVFLKYFFKFDKRNQNFWKIVLKIKENEINKNSKRKFEKDFL